MPEAAAPAAPAGGFGFDILARDAASRARCGRLATPHGAIDTPAFIFCATKAAIKGLAPEQMRAAGAQIILSNTYHLMVQPGADTVAALGGLHRLTGWDGPMLTDSGGFQIFSMGHGSVADEVKGRGQRFAESSLLKVSEDGAVFRSYLDGSKLTLTPEGAIDIQRKLGADLIVQLDECTPFHVDRTYTQKSMAMSHRWGDRCIAEFDRHDDGRQALYGIVQGGVYPDLRAESSAYTRDRPFFGTAIGGSLGADKEQMREVVGWCMDHVHPDRPVHLLGIGGIGDILAGVAMGIDTFDCVHPTRVARHGWALMKGAKGERVNLRNARFRTQADPLDPDCPCPACARPAGYLHHLVKASEPLALSLVTAHNVTTMTRLMAEIRAAIPAGRLAEVAAAWLAGDRAADDVADDTAG
ncbi:MAG: tRNA guanosine(34) transglycosylase Tgt [Rhodospirillaceae bacterium]|nr:tRNA guanosine(34) transglycosylase Tgt [Rhodospirillaceae bacterium]